MNIRLSYSTGFVLLCLFLIVGVAAGTARKAATTTATNVLVTNTSTQPVPVSVQGTPTVIASPSSAGYRVNNTTSNPVPVNIGTGGEVTVENGPTNPVVAALTGGVFVSNPTTSPVPTKQVGTAWVAVTGTPPIRVASPPSTFDTTRDMITLFDQNASDNIYAVPSGSKFIIDTVSAVCTATLSTPYATLTVQGNPMPNILSQLWIPTPLVHSQGGYYTNIGTMQAHLVCAGGTTLQYSFATPFGGNINTTEMTITGYLVPEP